MKKVLVTKNIDTIDLRDVNKNKAYLLLSDTAVYKLQRNIGEGGWFFASLTSSVSCSNGSQDTIEGAFRSVERFGDIYEVDNLRELTEVCKMSDKYEETL